MTYVAVVLVAQTTVSGGLRSHEAGQKGYGTGVSFSLAYWG